MTSPGDYPRLRRPGVAPDAAAARLLFARLLLKAARGLADLVERMGR
jgi:hypothetical protein